MSTAKDFELNVRGAILDAIAMTADKTGLVAGDKSEALQDAIYEALIRADVLRSGTVRTEEGARHGE